LSDVADRSVRWGIRVQPGAWLAPLLLACALTLWFGYELGLRALWAPDEGRYAEVPREMVASGDYLTPRLNGVKYFEKPPLMYWIGAASIRAFGLSEWSLRSSVVLFSLLGCMTVYLLGQRLHGPGAGFAAATVLALSPLYDLMGGVLSLDMPVTAWITVALAAFLLGVRAPPGTRRDAWLYASYAAMALAVLTKGMIGILLPALVIGAWVALLGEWRLLREIHLPTGLALAFAIAAPWHILVSQANPEFARFYFIHEHFERYLTTEHHRYQPAWYFVPVLILGFFPWCALLPQALRELWPGLWRERRQRREQWFLLLWAALPFAFFSLSDSKLIPYILPVLPPLALLLGSSIARAWARAAAPARAALRLGLALGVLFAAFWLALPRLNPGSASIAAAVKQFDGAYFVLAGAWLVAGVAPWVAARRGYGRLAWLALGAGAALLVLSLDLGLSHLDAGRSVKVPALALKRHLAPGDEVVAFREYFQDLPVYLERRVTVVDWKGELEFGARVEDTSAWMIDDAEFRRRWAGPRTVYLMASHANYKALRAGPPGPMCQVDSDARVVIAVNHACPP
jgi:4-amino-4-deoxy-L-arabinose transferase-like glycosyltransferase